MSGVLKITKVATDTLEFSKFSLKVFEDIVLKNKEYVDLVIGDIYKHQTYYMGLVDENDKVNFYQGKVKIVDPQGEELAKFEGKDYLNHIAEHVEPWTYVRFSYLKNLGWQGFIDGKNSGIFRVNSLARLNVARGMATPFAQAEYEKMYEILGGKPVHNTLAFHWARLIETIYAAERMLELAQDPELTDPNTRNIPTATPKEGVGVIESPRGTLIHHYQTDEKGILTSVNLIVAIQNNIAAICMSIEKVAKNLIKKGEVSDGILNMIEMAFRAYDPCLACATHSVSNQVSFVVEIYDNSQKLIKSLRR